MVRLLGEGGMGVVYVAEQLSTGRLRALKLMRSWSSGDEDARRFKQEARVGALIQSEHIVDVIAAGVDSSSGCPWLAMELLDGADLATYMAQKGALGLLETGAILRQVCAGLGAAHDSRLIHRDVKPENLFLTRSETAETGYVVKVLDFGIAKLLDGSAKTTRSIGSPLWMAPEQTQTRPELSCATDVWPLGLIAFAMLTGNSYWLSAVSPDIELAGVLREIVLTPLPMASERAAELNSPPLPNAFDAWFARCVVRDPAARFQHAREAWQAFEPMLVASGGPLRTSLAPAPVWTAQRMTHPRAISEVANADGTAVSTDSGAREPDQTGALGQTRGFGNDTSGTVVSGAGPGLSASGTVVSGAGASDEAWVAEASESPRVAGIGGSRFLGSGNGADSLATPSSTTGPSIVSAQLAGAASMRSRAWLVASAAAVVLFGVAIGVWALWRAPTGAGERGSVVTAAGGPAADGQASSGPVASGPRALAPFPPPLASIEPRERWGPRDAGSGQPSAAGSVSSDAGLREGIGRRGTRRPPPSLSVQVAKPPNAHPGNDGEPSAVPRPTTAERLPDLL